MPLVIPKAGPVRYVPTEEILAEILGHDNFDDEPWAVGDRLVFENGTESRIERVPGERFYEWPDPVPADFTEVSRAAGFEHAENWRELFGHFEDAAKRGGCAAAILLVTAVANAAAIAWPQ